MKLITLTQGKFAMVDDEDYDFLMQWEWCAIKSKNEKYYAVRNIYLGGGGKNRKSKMIMMHREIMKTPDGMEVDHIFHNTLDNRKSELRNCTHAQNLMNRTKKKNCSSKYLGVSLCRINKWVAGIRINSKSKFIGRFKSEIEAAKAYDKMAKKHNGEFANLNFK